MHTVLLSTVSPANPFSLAGLLSLVLCHCSQSFRLFCTWVTKVTQSASSTMSCCRVSKGFKFFLSHHRHKAQTQGTLVLYSAVIHMLAVNGVCVVCIQEHVQVEVQSHVHTEACTGGSAITRAYIAQCKCILLPVNAVHAPSEE